MDNVFSRSKKAQTVLIVIIAVILVILIALILVLIFFPTLTGNVIQNQGTTTTTTSSSSQTQTQSQTYNAVMQNIAFSPSSITIRQGDSVTWTNKDNVQHTVISDSGSELSSGIIQPGQTYSHTFNTPGTYTYHCNIHPMMTGTIIVTVSSLTSTSSSNQYTTTSYPSTVYSTPSTTSTVVVFPTQNNCYGYTYSNRGYCCITNYGEQVCNYNQNYMIPQEQYFYNNQYDYPTYGYSHYYNPNNNDQYHYSNNNNNYNSRY